MAKVIITVTDDDDGEGINVSMEFDPPIENEESATDAQTTALVMLKAASDYCGGAVSTVIDPAPVDAGVDAGVK